MNPAATRLNQATLGDKKSLIKVTDQQSIDSVNCCNRKVRKFSSESSVLLNNRKHDRSSQENLLINAVGENSATSWVVLYAIHFDLSRFKDIQIYPFIYIDKFLGVLYIRLYSGIHRKDQVL